MATLKDLTVLGASRFVSDLYGANIYQNGTKVSIEGHTHNYQPTGAYAPTGHTHTQYSPTGHTHSQYSPTGHTHTQYSPTGHKHTQYQPTGNYAPTGHTHTQYAPTGNYVTTNTVQTITVGKTMSGSDLTMSNSDLIMEGGQILLHSSSGGSYASITSYINDTDPYWQFATLHADGAPSNPGYVDGSYLNMDINNSWVGLYYNNKPFAAFQPYISSSNRHADMYLRNATGIWEPIDKKFINYAVTYITPQTPLNPATATGVNTKYYILGSAWHATDPTGLQGISISNPTPDDSPYMIGKEIYSGSDIALKKDIKPISDKFIDSLFTLSDIIYDFKWKDSSIPSSGFIAQYIEDIMPETIDGEEGTKHVNYDAALSKVVGAMFKKIKQLEDKINQQQLEINELKQNIKGRT